MRLRTAKTPSAKRVKDVKRAKGFCLLLAERGGYLGGPSLRVGDLKTAKTPSAKRVKDVKRAKVFFHHHHRHLPLGDLGVLAVQSSAAGLRRVLAVPFYASCAVRFDLPYLELPEIVLVPAGRWGSDSAPLSLKPFGILVACGVYAGALCATRYGQRRGIDSRVLASFIYYVVGFGFVLGHVLDVIFYSPERIVADPWSLFRLWDGLSSFGGFIGGAVGALLWRYRQQVAVLPYADVVASALPLGWVFGRAGCALAHDHPGIASQAWFAVAYPGGSRLDLGLIEMGLSVPLAAVFLLMQRRSWPWGFFLGCLCTTYAPLRFGLDFLRLREPLLLESSELVADRRYAALTPAQWACLALALFGLGLLRRALAASEKDSAFAAPLPPPAFAAARRARQSRRRADSESDLQGRGDDASDER